MEGQSRPTFFRGVATVVTKLFNIVQPDLAFFGQKDIQQCLILRRLIADLHLPHPPSPTHLRIVPTVRDTDNVALSSRNAYLTEIERRYAPILIGALHAAQGRAMQGNGETSVEDILAAAEAGMSSFLDMLASTPDPPEKVDIVLDYIKVNDPLTLVPMNAIRKGEAAVISGAVRIGNTRLIDNVLVNIEL
jgi:pantoate--beta-alanine ligase